MGTRQCLYSASAQSGTVNRKIMVVSNRGSTVQMGYKHCTLVDAEQLRHQIGKAYKIDNLEQYRYSLWEIYIDDCNHRECSPRCNM